MKLPFQILPPLSDDDLDRLKASIIEHGIEVPVVVDEDGNIIDGHHRAMIADSLGIEYPRVVHAGLNDAQKRILAATLNIARRHMTDAQKVRLGMEIEPDIAAEANTRSLANLNNSSTVPIGTVEESKPRTSVEVAETVGVSSWRSYERYKALLIELENEPDGEQLMKYIDDGDWTIKDARAELKRRHPPVRKSAPVAVDPPAEHEPAARPPKFPTPVIVPPTGMIPFDAAMAIKNLRGLDTTNYVEASDYLIELDRDVEGLIESLPDILRAVKRIASRANRQLNKKRIAA